MTVRSPIHIVNGELVHFELPREISLTHHINLNTVSGKVTSPLPLAADIVMSSRARKREPDAESDSIDDHRSSKRTRGNVSKGNPNPNHADLLAGQGKLDSNGDIYWEISKARRLTISSFCGKTLVSIREYYEKDGHELPGKKVCLLCSNRPRHETHRLRRESLYQLISFPLL